METIEVRITGTDEHKWYKDKIGYTFLVHKEPWDGALHVLADQSQGRDGFGIRADHFEVVQEDKIVEHEGIKYKVPAWATYLTRDENDGLVFAWDQKPEWNPLPRGWRGNGRFKDVKPYIEPKPEGNFIKEI